MVRTWTRPLIEAVINQTVVRVCFDPLFSLFSKIKFDHQYWGEQLLKVDPNAQILNPLEIFLPTMFQHGDPGAWPPSGDLSPALLPQASQWSWTTGPETDAAFIDGQRQQADFIAQLADSEGQGSSNLALYPNYALYGVPVEQLYGSANMKRLQRIKSIYDPKNIMGLAGGWKVPV